MLQLSIGRNPFLLDYKINSHAIWPNPPHELRCHAPQSGSLNVACKFHHTDSDISAGKGFWPHAKMDLLVEILKAVDTLLRPGPILCSEQGDCASGFAW